MRKGKMMKKIKKLGITALAAVLVVSAAGCGKRKKKIYKNSDIVMSVKDKNGDKLKIDYADSQHLFTNHAGGSLQLHELSVKPV